MEHGSEGRSEVGVELVKEPARWANHPMIRVERRTFIRMEQPKCAAFADDAGGVEPTVFFYDDAVSDADLRPDNCRGFMKYPTVDAMIKDGWRATDDEVSRRTDPAG